MTAANDCLARAQRKLAQCWARYDAARAQVERMSSDDPDLPDAMQMRAVRRLDWEVAALRVKRLKNA